MTWRTHLDSLRAGFKGVLLTPEDPGYEVARPIWNAMWDEVRPALIARCTGHADVRAVVRFAREHELPCAVRGGGHSASGKGTCDGGVVIDLSTLKGVQVDARAGTAVAGGGCLWEDFDREVQSFGLVTPGGVVSHTGIGGFALGGGIGWLSRRFGLTCDNLLAADLVTADGEYLRASAEEHPELFWGLRGGGGNFGVVTHFTLRLHALPDPVTCGILLWPLERLAEAWEGYAQLAQSAPDELGCALGLMRAPQAPFVDPALHDQLVAGFFFCWSGAPARVESVIQPMLARRPATRFVAPMPYTAMQKMVDFLSPHGRRSYWKAGYLAALDASVPEIAQSRMQAAVSPFTQTEFVLLGGQVARVPEDATAFGERSAPLIYNIVVNWLDAAHDARGRAWASAFFESLQPYSTGSVYVNFLGDEGDARVRCAYGAKFDRLARLKRRYDPDNFFRFNQNIAPA